MRAQPYQRRRKSICGRKVLSIMSMMMIGGGERARTLIIMQPQILDVSRSSGRYMYIFKHNAIEWYRDDWSGRRERDHLITVSIDERAKLMMRWLMSTAFPKVMGLHDV